MFGFGENPSALSQVLIVAFTCFCCPGLFNALTSFAAGISDDTVAYNGNSIIYGFFAVFGLVAGGLVNFIGPRRTLFIGTWGYVVYAISLLVMQHTSKPAFYYIACAILGMCAGLLWTAQGQMCMAYPTTATKGLYFSIFWIIFNLGATLGGFLAFGVNYNNASSHTSDGVYIAFIVVMALGCCISLLLADPEKVVRNDGTLIKIEKLPDWKGEAVNILKLFADVKMLLLFPIFAYSNWFYTYHTFYNVHIFNGRTTGFTSAFYWGSQMVGSLFIGMFLDNTYMERKTKARASIFLLLALTSLMWGLGLWAQNSYDLTYNTHLDIDFKDGGDFGVKFVLYMFYGFNDAICQVWSYWLMGQLSDDITTLGRYAGYYKGVQSGMAAISWKIGGSKVDPVTQLAVNWIMCGAGIVSAYFCVQWYVVDEPAKEIQSSPMDTALLPPKEAA